MVIIFDKDKQPGTVKSYLGALNQFYVFLKCECVEVDVSPATRYPVCQIKLNCGPGHTGSLARVGFG